MKRLIAIGISAALVGCATETGNKRHAQHAQDQIKMVAVQREAQLKEVQADAQTNTALVEALAEISRTNPDSASAAVVALAVIGVSGQGAGASGGNGTPSVVTLQRQQNEALEWTKALAPTVGGLVSGLGVAAINANVQKNASDNAARVQINDAQSDVAIVEAVAGLGTAAASSVGIQAGGDIYQIDGQSSVDQSVTETTTTTTTNTTSFSLATTLNYDGTGMTLGELISQLRNAGATYSIDLDGDGAPDVEGGDGEGETVEINCDAPQFSPAPPECT